MDSGGMDSGGMIEAAGADPLELAYEDLSDLGNARRLIARARDRLLHAPALGWLAWNGRYWDRDHGDMLAHRLAHETAVHIRTEAEALLAHADALAAKGKGQAATAARERADSLYGHAVQSGNAARTAAMLTQAQHYIRVETDALDPDRMMLTAMNGTIRMRAEIGDALDVRLCPHEPADLITRAVRTGYDPDADCPEWRRHLETVLPDPEMRGYLQRCLGYSITGENGEQCYFICQGMGGDGKSTTLSVVRRVLGGYAATADVRTFLEDGSRRSGAEASPDLARLSGDIRLVVCAEPPRGAKLAERVIKSITGGEPMPARHLAKELFEYQPRYKLWMLVNSLPVIRGDDDGIWRRTKVIRFPVQIPRERRDLTLEDRLVETEAPGILRWLVDGVAAWRAEGLWEPGEVAAAIADYRATSNPFGEWFMERVERDPLADSPSRALYNDYQAWCEEASVEPMSHTAFGRALGDRQVGRRKNARGNIMRRGVRLKPAADDLVE